MGEALAVPLPELRDGYAIARTALSLRGIPYRLGGTDPSGFDCSGLVQYVYALHGLGLPRVVRDQYRYGATVKLDALEPGDLVFFNTLKRTFSHVGIYIGDGRFIHAPRSGSEVRIEDMRYAYWAQRFTGARRVAALADTPAGLESTLLQSGS